MYMGQGLWSWSSLGPSPKLLLRSVHDKSIGISLNPGVIKELHIPAMHSLSERRMTSFTSALTNDYLKSRTRKDAQWTLWWDQPCCLSFICARNFLECGDEGEKQAILVGNPASSNRTVLVSDLLTLVLHFSAEHIGDLHLRVDLVFRETIFLSFPGPLRSMLNA